MERSGRVARSAGNLDQDDDLDLLVLFRGDWWVGADPTQADGSGLAVLWNQGGDMPYEIAAPTMVPTAAPMAYLAANHALPNHEVYAEVRGKRQPMRVAAMPFTPHRYHRG